MRRGALLVAALALAGCSVRAAPPVLTVCADPNNLPFSNRAGEGFENRLAAMVAHDLGREVRLVSVALVAGSLALSELPYEGWSDGRTGSFRGVD